MANAPAMTAPGGSGSNKVTNFVGKVVNGFEIQKLIGKSRPCSLARLGKVLVRLPCEANRRQRPRGAQIDQGKTFQG
jgi:hypothetical protein